MKTIQSIYLMMQIVFAFIICMFGVFSSIRCIILHTNCIYASLFAILAFVGYKLMFRPSIAEWRAHRQPQRKEVKR